MATTDDIGATARRTLHGQEKPVGLVLRGHFLTEEVRWPVQIGGTAAHLPRWTARPHQVNAIDAVVNGFRGHDRGRLIMACGTGKTLTALWIAERLQSSLTLVLVPSLSLVQQNLAEWGRHSIQDFDTLVVCSDESVVQRNEDTVLQSTADLGVRVTTDPAEIRHFLGQRRQRPAVVFATYQSSDRIAAAQRPSSTWQGEAPAEPCGRRIANKNGSAGASPSRQPKPFDLAICDEAHRLAGHAEGLFATVLDDKKIKARKRLFMTATPRYFKEHVKRRAAGLEFELVSMDDAHVFGPEFHVLTFHEAISAKPEPLLTDYQVVVIGVTDREAKACGRPMATDGTDGGTDGDTQLWKFAHPTAQATYVSGLGRRATAEGRRGFQPTVGHPAKPSRRGATIEPSLRHRAPKGCVSSSPHIQSTLRVESFLCHRHPWVETHGNRPMTLRDGRRLGREFLRGCGERGIGYHAKRAGQVRDGVNGV